MINTNANTKLLVSAVGLIAAASPLLADQARASAASDSAVGSSMEALNFASLKSIESSWLEVPEICKARNFNAAAVELSHKEAQKAVQAFYAAYEV